METKAQLAPQRMVGLGSTFPVFKKKAVVSTENGKEFGEITLSQMLHEWALHDLGHIRQIAELVRARRYRAGAGPMAASYDLRP